MMEEEEQAMKSASQQLGQYWKAGNNAQAVLSWRERLKRDSQKDLQKVREQGKVRVQGLRLQIEACDEKLLRAQEEVQRLREYKDRQRPTFLLQIAALQRQILRLSQTNKSPIAQIPLSLRRMCLENHRMKQQIYMYKQEMGHLQEQISKLQHMGNDLQNCWVYETRSAWKMLVEKSCRCAPNDDFVLDLPI
eukprot:XP_004920539.1 PREDICTED: uncharacterized protein C20orf96 homolog isoform X3 [Xenopus tropicalis]